MIIFNILSHVIFFLISSLHMRIYQYHITYYRRSCSQSSRTSQHLHHDALTANEAKEHCLVATHVFRPLLQLLLVLHASALGLGMHCRHVRSREWKGDWCFRYNSLHYFQCSVRSHRGWTNIRFRTEPIWKGNSWWFLIAFGCSYALSVRGTENGIDVLDINPCIIFNVRFVRTVRDLKL